MPRSSLSQAQASHVIWTLAPSEDCSCPSVGVEVVEYDIDDSANSPRVNSIRRVGRPMEAVAVIRVDKADCLDAGKRKGGIVTHRSAAHFNIDAMLQSYPVEMVHNSRKHHCVFLDHQRNIML